MTNNFEKYKAFLARERERIRQAKLGRWAEIKQADKGLPEPLVRMAERIGERGECEK